MEFPAGAEHGGVLDTKLTFSLRSLVPYEWVYQHIKQYCNKFAGSVSQWKFTTLTVQYTTLDYSSQLF
jgi:hypothetical protein